MKEKFKRTMFLFVFLATMVTMVSCGVKTNSKEVPSPDPVAPAIPLPIQYAEETEELDGLETYQDWVEFIPTEGNQISIEEERPLVYEYQAVDGQRAYIMDVGSRHYKRLAADPVAIERILLAKVEKRTSGLIMEALDFQITNNCAIPTFSRIRPARVDDIEPL